MEDIILNHISMSNSVFKEELYDADELERLNLAVSRGEFKILTCILNPMGMTREKEADIQRVLNILQPKVNAPPFQELMSRAIESKEDFGTKALVEPSEDDGKVAAEQKAPRGRPKKIHEKVVELS